MDYVDTSVFVAAFVREAHTAGAERWLTRHPGDPIAISDWTITELSSALSLKLRMGSIGIDVRDAALEAFSELMAASLDVLSVSSAHFRTAATFADQHRLGLRAPDALHLAIAGDAGATLVTLDKRLAAAGKKLGVATRLL